MQLSRTTAKGWCAAPRRPAFVHAVFGTACCCPPLAGPTQRGELPKDGPEQSHVATGNASPGLVLFCALLRAGARPPSPTKPSRRTDGRAFSCFWKFLPLNVPSQVGFSFDAAGAGSLSCMQPVHGWLVQPVEASTACVEASVKGRPERIEGVVVQAGGCMFPHPPPVGPSLQLPSRLRLGARQCDGHPTDSSRVGSSGLDPSGHCAAMPCWPGAMFGGLVCWAVVVCPLRCIFVLFQVLAISRDWTAAGTGTGTDG